MAEMIDHPAHYNQPGRKECIEEMLEIFGPDAVHWFCVLNAYKYRYRAGHKGEQSFERDMSKADWYTDYAVRLEEKGLVKHEN